MIEEEEEESTKGGVWDIRRKYAKRRQGISYFTPCRRGAREGEQGEGGREAGRVGLLTNDPKDFSQN